MTFILVGTKSDRVFENQGFQNDDFVKESIQNFFQEQNGSNSDMSHHYTDDENQFDTTANQEDVNELDEEQKKDINTMAKFWAKRKGFACYLPTSSLLGENVKNIFDEAIQQTFNNRMEKLKHLTQQQGKEA